MQAHVCSPCPDASVDKWLSWEWWEAESTLLFSFVSIFVLSLKQTERSCVTEHNSINGKKRRLTPSDRFWYREAYF